MKKFGSRTRMQLDKIEFKVNIACDPDLEPELLNHTPITFIFQPKYIEISIYYQYSCKNDERNKSVELETDELWKLALNEHNNIPDRVTKTVFTQCILKKNKIGSIATGFSEYKQLYYIEFDVAGVGVVYLSREDAAILYKKLMNWWTTTK